MTFSSFYVQLPSYCLQHSALYHHYTFVCDYIHNLITHLIHYFLIKYLLYQFPPTFSVLPTGIELLSAQSPSSPSIHLRSHLYPSEKSGSIVTASW